MRIKPKHEKKKKLLKFRVFKPTSPKLYPVPLKTTYLLAHDVHSRDLHKDPCRSRPSS